LEGSAEGCEEVEDGGDPPSALELDGDDAVGGPAVTVVRVPLIVVSINADVGLAVVAVPLVVACLSATRPARIPLVRTKRQRRND
jgi:hypothetical protein